MQVFLQNARVEVYIPPPDPNSKFAPRQYVTVTEFTGTSVKLECDLAVQNFSELAQASASGSVLYDFVFEALVRAGSREGKERDVKVQTLVIAQVVSVKTKRVSITDAAK